MTGAESSERTEKEEKQPKTHDNPLNKIKAAGNLYECRDCGRQFETISAAENHKQEKSGGTPIKHDYKVVSRD